MIITTEKSELTYLRHMMQSSILTCPHSFIMHFAIQIRSCLSSPTFPSPLLAPIFILHPLSILHPVPSL